MADCTFPDCGKHVVAKGMCSGHYNQARKGQQLRILLQTGSPDGVAWAQHPCLVDDCSEPAHCRGYCQRHYTAVKHYGDPLIVRRRSREDARPDEKTCSKCSTLKPIVDFPLRPEAIDGHRGVCRECIDRQTIRKTSRRYGVITECMFDGCDKPTSSQGRCHSHAAQWERTGEMWPVGAVRPAYNMTGEENARQFMLDAGFNPSVPYQGANTPWAGVCLRCGHPGRPRLGHLLSRNSDPCGVCAGKVIPDDIRWGRMVNRGFIPLEPYPGGAHAKWLTVHTCGAQVRISYKHATTNITPWCVHCMELGGYRPKLKGWFYTVTDGQLIKAGVTNRPRRRMSKHAEAGLTQRMHYTAYLDGGIPLQMEEQWRAFVRDAGYFQVAREVLPDGYTEAVIWHDEAVKFLAELCQRTQESRGRLDPGRCVCSTINPYDFRA